MLPLPSYADERRTVAAQRIAHVSWVAVPQLSGAGQAAGCETQRPERKRRKLRRAPCQRGRRSAGRPPASAWPRRHRVVVSPLSGTTAVAGVAVSVGSSYALFSLACQSCHIDRRSIVRIYFLLRFIRYCARSLLSSALQGSDAEALRLHKQQERPRRPPPLQRGGCSGSATTRVTHRPSRFGSVAVSALRPRQRPALAFTRIVVARLHRRAVGVSHRERPQIRQPKCRRVLLDPCGAVHAA